MGLKRAMMKQKIYMLAISTFILAPWTHTLLAQTNSQRMTVSQKCEFYKNLWLSLTVKTGKSEFSPLFFQSHEDFINGGCIDYSGVCPTTAKDLEFANKLTVGAMSSGLASTFLPFKCRTLR